MFYSNCAILIKVTNDSDLVLKNISFEKDSTFYSLFIHQQNGYTTGEIHWSKSFQLGKFDIVSFIKIKDIFVLFTSSVQNYIPFKIIIEYLSNNVIVNLLKIPVPVPKKEITIPEVSNLNIDKIFGLNFTILLDKQKTLSKIYTNGLITYSMLAHNDFLNAVNILKIIINIIEEFND